VAVAPRQLARALRRDRRATQVAPRLEELALGRAIGQLRGAVREPEAAVVGDVLARGQRAVERDALDLVRAVLLTKHAARSS
jgi:hypothetical protein